MKFKTISYRRTNNLGNYNSETIELFAEIGEDEDIDECTAKLKYHAEYALGLRQNIVDQQNLPEGDEEDKPPW